MSQLYFIITVQLMNDTSDPKPLLFLFYFLNVLILMLSTNPDKRNSVISLKKSVSFSCQYYKILTIIYRKCHHDCLWGWHSVAKTLKMEIILENEVKILRTSVPEKQWLYFVHIFKKKKNKKWNNFAYTLACLDKLSFLWLTRGFASLLLLSKSWNHFKWWQYPFKESQAIHRLKCSDKSNNNKDISLNNLY